ncbi:MAG: hypothetical protein QXU79_04680 [Candidatus Micrarchaeaceae archaeon]
MAEEKDNKKDNFKDFQFTDLKSFIDDLIYAKNAGKNVLVYASGTYKGISGQVYSIDGGTLVLISTGKRVRIKIGDIRRIEIFESD